MRRGIAIGRTLACLAAAWAIAAAPADEEWRRIVVNGQIHGHLMELSVRDDGIGFDPASIPPERWGVRQSIVRRMEDAGGRAEIRSERGAASASGVVMASGVGMAAGVKSEPVIESRGDVLLMPFELIVRVERKLP